MTYDNTDTNADGAIDAPIENESVSTEEVAPTDPSGEKQVVIKGLGSSNELQDIDNATQDKGVFIDRSQAAKDNGENIRLILGKNVVLGWHNGTETTELIKTYNDTVNIENDRSGKGIALESRRGGNVALKTSTGTGTGDKLARFLVDDNQSSETNVKFQNLNEMTLEGDIIKIRQDNSVSPTFKIKPQSSNEANTSITRTIMETNGLFDFRVDATSYFDIQDNELNVKENLILNGNPIEDMRVESSVPSTVRAGEMVIGDGTGGSGEDELFISADGSTISRITADSTV